MATSTGSRRRRSKASKSGNKQEKSSSLQGIEQGIAQKLQPGEQLVEWTNGQTTPPEWMSWVPILKIKYSLGVKNFFLAVTQEALYIIRFKGITNRQFLETSRLPLTTLKTMSIKKGVLDCHLIIKTAKNELLFKGFEPQAARNLVQATKKLRAHKLQSQ